MKKTIIAGGLAAVSLAAVIGGAALAQQTQGSQTLGSRHAQPVTQAEFVQAKVGRLTALDADRDGTVSTDEMRAGAEARHAERRSKRFDRLDADKNGQISRAEFDVARAGHRGPGEGQNRVQRMGRRGGEGHGPAQRMARQGPVVIADVQTRLTENFARRDMNHDGVLSPEERKAGRAAMRERRAERMAARPGRPGPATSTSPSTPASE